MVIDETKVNDYTKEELGEFFEQLDLIEDEWKAEKAIVAQRLQELMTNKEELIGDKIFTKVHKIVYKPEIGWCQEVGAVKEAIDTSKANRIIKSMVGNEPKLISKDGATFVKVGDLDIEASESRYLIFKKTEG